MVFQNPACHFVRALCELCELVLVHDQRDHNLGVHYGPGFCPAARSFDNCLHLHFENLRVGDCQPATAMAQHRVELVELLDALRNVLGRYIDLLGQSLLVLDGVRQKFVQWRIEQPNSHGPLAHGLEDAGEITTLDRQQPFQRLAALRFGLGQDHLLEPVDTPVAEEHVLCATEADAFGAHADCHLGIAGAVSICAYLDFSQVIGPGHQLFVFLRHRRIDQVHVALVDLARGAVECDVVAFLEAVAVDAHAFLRVIDRQRIAPDDTALAPTTGDYSSVARLTAGLRQDAAGSVHAADIFRAGFLANQNHTVLPCCSFGRIGGEINSAGCSAGHGIDACCQQRVAAIGGTDVRVDLRIEESLDVFGFDTADGLGFFDQAFFDHVDSDLKGRHWRAFAATCLQHVERTVFDSKLDVLHVAVMPLESLAHLHELFIGAAIATLQCRQLHRCADAGNHVFALGVEQVVTVEDVSSGIRVASERDSGAAGFAFVAEYHGTDIDAGAVNITPTDFFDLAIGDSLIGHPTVEDCIDRADELVPGILGKFLTNHFSVFRLETVADIFQFVGIDFGVTYGLFFIASETLGDNAVFVHFENVFKLFFAQPHGCCAVHHDEAAVGVIGEARVFRFRGKTFDGFVVETEVEDGLHHAGHR